MKIISTGNLTKTKSCGCLFIEAIRKTGPKNKQNPQPVVYDLVYMKYRQRAKDTELAFELSESAFYSLIAQDCAYCGSVGFNSLKTYPTVFYNGIDRIDNSKGYIADNVVPCCAWCNRMKAEKTTKAFMQHIKKIWEYNNGTNTRTERTGNTAVLGHREFGL